MRSSSRSVRCSRTRLSRHPRSSTLGLLGGIAALALSAGALADEETSPPPAEQGIAAPAFAEAPWFPSGPVGGACANRSEAVIQVDALARSMDRFIAGAHDMGYTARQLATEVVDALVALPNPQKQQICSDLERVGIGASSIDRINDALTASRAPAGCVGLETYRAILGVETVFLSFGQATQGLCDATACYDPFDTPGTCAIFCVPPAIWNGLAEIIAIRRDISDKCANETHEDLMDTARADASVSFGRLLNSVNEAMRAVLQAANTAATEFDLQATGNEAAAGFDGGGGRATSNGIGPGLDALAAALESSAMQQRDFEAEAVEARIEAAIIQALPVSRLQLPRAQGGLLERVRETVAGRIQSAAGVGLPVQSALQAFRLGDLAFNEARFKDAYANYVQAYADIGAARRVPTTETGGAE